MTRQGIELVYSPNQYYYIKDGRKVYLYSRYPTFSINYAKALKNVLNTTTSYNKLEFDMHQTLDLGPLSQLSYRVGTGFFFNSTNLNFTDYNYLKRGNMPEGWNDDIGGTFQLLRSHQYRHIEKYIRAHIKYDAPLLLVPTISHLKYSTRRLLSRTSCMDFVIIIVIIRIVECRLNCNVQTDIVCN